MAPPQPGPAVLPPHSMDKSPEFGVGTRPSSSSSGVLLTKLIMRALTSVLTFISLIILTTNTATYNTINGIKTYKFNDICISYRYLLFTILLGLLYSLLQTALTIFRLINGKRVSCVLVYLDLYGDLVLLYALATGAAAGFAATIDTQGAFKALDGSNVLDKFFEKGYATAGLILLGSVCSAVSLVLSAFGLEGRL